MNKKYLFFILLFISGCTNVVEKYYSGMSVQESNAKFGNNKNETPMLVKITNDEEIYNIAANNYAIIGESNFNTTGVSEDEMLSFGKKINAELITFFYQYTHTVDSTYTITIPNFSTTNTTVSNRYGYTLGYIDSNTTSYSTQQIPYSTRMYDYHITFWRKDPRKPKLGLQVLGLTQQEQAKIQSYKGVCVIVVINGSPAYKNDILPYDIITKINNKEIYNVKDFYEYLQSFNGNSIKLEIFRNNKLINKTIKLD